MGFLRSFMHFDTIAKNKKPKTSLQFFNRIVPQKWVVCIFVDWNLLWMSFRMCLPNLTPKYYFQLKLQIFKVEKWEKIYALPSTHLLLEFDWFQTFVVWILKVCNFKLFSLVRVGCRRSTNFCQRRRRVTDGNFFLL